jgi:hypothetical protein
MFAIISILDKIPSVIDVSTDKSLITDLLETRAIDYVIDNVGKNNWINTLTTKDVNFPIYPNYILTKTSPTEISISKIYKQNIVSSGWIYNSTAEIEQKEYIGSFYILDVKHAHINLNNKLKIINKQIDNSPSAPVNITPQLKRNFNQVLLEMAPILLKRKIE